MMATSTQTARPRIAITLGDPSGIGPEITAAALAQPQVRRALEPLVFGDDAAWSEACRRARCRDELPRVASAQQATGAALVTVGVLSASDRRPGKPTPAGGSAQLAWLDAACAAIEERLASGLCTAPLSKAQVNRAGLAFSGHTEYLAERFGARVLMLLAGPRLRVAVHTTHLALADVPGALSGDEIVRDLQLLDRELGPAFGLRRRPRLAVCALNPHAGEDGLLGKEELRIIAPAVRRAQALGVDASGPHAADGLFPHVLEGKYDAVLAMYHDQGLIPMKMLDFDEGVNVTLGLPIPRTSPDHGVAYDLAGTGRARPQSMVAALLLAARLAKAPRRSTPRATRSGRSPATRTLKAKVARG